MNYSLSVSPELDQLITESIDVNVFWATSVHNLLIDEAFSDVSKPCRLAMQAGSLNADSAKYQSLEYSYIHAMRSHDQTVEQAKELMLEFIRKQYNLANAYETMYGGDKLQYNYRLKSCFYRGMALHPVMDSTSPAHSDFQIWHPHKLEKIMEHGDAREFVIKTFGFGLGLPHSKEDMQALEANPDIRELTIKKMQQIDSEYFWGFKEKNNENEITR